MTAHESRWVHAWRELVPAFFGDDWTTWMGRAKYLINYRDKNGPFRSLLKRVPSFDDGMIENLRDAGLAVGKDDAGHHHAESNSRREDTRFQGSREQPLTGHQ